MEEAVHLELNKCTVLKWGRAQFQCVDSNDRGQQHAQSDRRTMMVKSSARFNACAITCMVSDHKYPQALQVIKRSQDMRCLLMAEILCESPERFLSF